ncbi:glycoside hydrolase family 3 N-terminal domain-containing protein [Persicobacter diffluens]|uniref:beta-glucosidase n=1 Tax=Persicobacter diffluens TaxID=981 RepID=A0AAN4W4M0_9BACT|nr:beta-glucosidase [Persicobacter diffluens]
MKRYIFLSYLFFISCQAEKTPEGIPQKVDALMRQMTWEEKVGQLHQAYVERPTDSIMGLIKAGKMGSMLNGRTTFYTLKDRNEMQRIAVEESRLGIPLLFAHDVVHGFKTSFPINLAQACSWNPDLVQQVAVVAGKEARSQGVDWAFAPMMDVSRDPRWGRVSECYGEDPLLNALMGSAVVKGYQGDELSEKSALMACMKHFVGYSAPDGGRDYQSTDFSKTSLFNTYLPPFKSAVEAGAFSAMSSFNEIDGTPVTASKNLIADILKEQWQFDGVVVSDWDAVVQLMDHGVADTKSTAGKRALLAGVDVEMKSDSYFSALEKGLTEEQQSAIDEACRRVLTAKFKLGLFDNPYASQDPSVEKLNRKLAKKIAQQSIVLLKNDQVLPLTESKKNIALMGPFADTQKVLGYWKSIGKSADAVSLSKALSMEKGLNISPKISPQTDLIIYCAGEQEEEFGEANSKYDCRLSAEQRAEIQALSEGDIPVVLVVFNGRPLVLTEEEKQVEGIVLAWHLGLESGHAIADVLTGRYNPSGRLPITFPKSTGQIPIYYNHKPSGRPQSNNYKGELGQPLYPFGFGLSYGHTEISEPIFSKDTFQKSDTLTFEVKVKNNSDLTVKETVQVYFHDPVAWQSQPVKRLLTFKQIDLEGRDEQVVKFEVPVQALGYYDSQGKYILEEGAIHIFSGKDAQVKSFTPINISSS